MLELLKQLSASAWLWRGLAARLSLPLLGWGDCRTHGVTCEYVVSTSTTFPSVSIYLMKITLYITSLCISLILIDRFFDLLDNWNIVESNNADEESVQMVVGASCLNKSEWSFFILSKRLKQYLNLGWDIALVFLIRRETMSYATACC